MKLVSPLLSIILLLLLFLVQDTRSLLDEGCERIHTDCARLDQASNGTRTITFGLMLSFADPARSMSLNSDFDDGHDIAPAVYLAVQQINNRSDLLDGYRVEISRFDGGCDVHTRTRVGVNQLVCSCDPIVGLIGPSCEHSSQVVSHITNEKGYSLLSINYGGEDESVARHPYAFGVLGTNAMYNKAVIELMKLNSWTNVALLYLGNDGLYSKRVTDMIRLANVSGNSLRYISAVYDTYVPIQEVKDSFSRIIVVLAPPKTIHFILCLAFHEDMLYPSYQWVFEEVYGFFFEPTTFKYGGKLYTCSVDDFRTIANQSIHSFLSAFMPDSNIPRTNDNIIPVNEYSSAYEQAAQDYSEVYGVKSFPVNWATGFYDATWALGLALNKTLSQIGDSITEFKPGSKELADILRKNILDVDFYGVTGQVRFNSQGYNKAHVLYIYQYDARLERSNRIASFGNNTISFAPNTSSNFIDASFETRYEQIDWRVAGGILLLTLLAFVLVVVAQAVNIIYRKHKVIKASSPTINHLIFVGCYLIIAGIVFHTLETFHAINDAIKYGICNIVPYTLNIGITLFLGTVCIKTWRLNRLFARSRRLARGGFKCLNDWSLAGFVSILVVCDVFVCILWNVLDPLKPEHTRTIALPRGRKEPIVIERVSCVSNYTIYWLFLLLIPKAVLTFSSFLLAFFTRIKRKEFKTSNVIILTYLLAIIFGLGISLYVIFLFVTDFDVMIKAIILSTCLDISVCICILMLFLPLFHDMFYKVQSARRS